MTRFGIDALAALRIVRDEVDLSAHQLVAPSGLRSEAMAILYGEVRDGTTAETDARDLLERLTSLKVRVLGDRVSRATAWRIALDNGWDDLHDAEYIAVTRLQADTLIALDAALAARATPLVPVAPFDDLAR